MKFPGSGRGVGGRSISGGGVSGRGVSGSSALACSITSYHYEKVVDMSTPPPTHRGARNVDQHDPTPPRSDLPGEPEEIPLGQRLLERPFLLLVMGILIMAVFFTGWGLFEILTLPPAPLP